MTEKKHRTAMGAFLILVLLLVATPAGAVEKVDLMLDWYPNPDHVPIYVAVAEGFFAREGLDLSIQVPADPNDPLKLVAAGQTAFAVSYQPSVIMARAEGLPVVSIGALVQHPLSSILYLKSSGIKTPADLKGKKIGYSVDPLYRVLFEAVAQNAGLKPEDYEAIRVGFNLVPPLLSGQVDAVCGAFRNFEAIQVELEGQEVGIFPLEEHGVPDFYELVFIANSKTVKEKPEIIQAFDRAITKALAQVESDPVRSLATFFKMNENLKDELNRRAFYATQPFFKGSPAQTLKRWQDMAQFMLQWKLISQPVAAEDLMWSPPPAQ